MHIAVRSFPQTTWAQRLFVGVVGGNMALILFGIDVVPSAITALPALVHDEIGDPDYLHSG